MIIGVDGNEANVAEKVGVSVYVYELLHYFSQKSNNELQFIVYLRNSPRADLPSPKKYFQYKRVKGDFLWSQLFLPLYLYFNRDIEVFFSPAHYAPRFCPVSTVVTIHDLSYFYYPDEFLKKDLYQLKNWTKYSVEQAKKIIAVSKNTKKDVMSYYHIPENKIEVIYNGYDNKLKVSRRAGSPSSQSEIPYAGHTGSFATRFAGKNVPQSAIPLRGKKLKIQLKGKNYILYVGTIQPRKNLQTLINAFDILVKEKPEYSLVITGKKGWLYKEIFDQVKYLNLADKVIFTGYLSDEEKAALYAHALFFVIPSLYEGFGIPLLEAMSYDCPVIVSSASSLPEIGGDACLYFDPKNPKELKEKMIAIIENIELRKELIKKGKERVQLFSWQKCGQETLEVIKMLHLI